MPQGSLTGIGTEDDEPDGDDEDDGQVRTEPGRDGGRPGSVGRLIRT
jgi:hypothetical protein